MANFQLRDVDDQQWSRVMVRAQLEGWPLRELMLALLDDYQAGRVKPTKPAPLPRPRVGGAVGMAVVVLKFTCPKCNRAMEAEVDQTAGLPKGPMDFYAVPCPHCGKVTERALPGPLIETFKAGERPKSGA